MKMTIVTNKDGAIVAAHHGAAPQPDTTVTGQSSNFRAGLLAGPGQHIHVVEVPETLLQVTLPAELEAHLKRAVAKGK